MLERLRRLFRPTPTTAQALAPQCALETAPEASEPPATEASEPPAAKPEPLPDRAIPYRYMGPVAAAIAQTNTMIGTVRSDKRIARASWWLYKRLDLDPENVETPEDAVAFFGKPVGTHVRTGTTSTGHPIAAVWNGPADMEPPDGDSPYVPYWG